MLQHKQHTSAYSMYETMCHEDKPCHVAFLPPGAITLPSAHMPCTEMKQERWLFKPCMGMHALGAES